MWPPPRTVFIRLRVARVSRQIPQNAVVKELALMRAGLTTPVRHLQSPQPPPNSFWRLTYRPAPRHEMVMAAAACPGCRAPRASGRAAGVTDPGLAVSPGPSTSSLEGACRASWPAGPAPPPSEPEDARRRRVRPSRIFPDRTEAGQLSGDILADLDGGRDQHGAEAGGIVNQQLRPRVP